MIWIDIGMPPMSPNRYISLMISIWESLHIYRQLGIIRYIWMPHIRYISIQNQDFYIEISITRSAFGWFFLYIDASYSMNLCLYRSLSPSLSLSEFLYHCRHSGIFLMNMNMPCSIIHIFLHLPMPISHDQDRQLDDPFHI